jgi:uncharacterized membrane protein YdjX (TVP38/TMEM64 family)
MGAGSPPAACLRRAGRFVLLGSIALGSVAAWRWRSALDPRALSTAIDGWPAAPVVFLAIHVAASLLFVPRTVLAVAAGLLFGLGWGTFWAALGSVVGAVAGFLVARYVGADFVFSGSDGRLRSLLQRVERGGWRAVAGLRLIPVIPHSLGNYALGLTRLRLAPYALGSLVGQLPMTLAYVGFGAAGERLMVGANDWIAPTLIGAAALAVSSLIPFVARRGTARSGR